MKETNRNKIWAISASDSCAGAGLQADLKMAHAMNVECATLVSALTAQSSFGVEAVEAVSVEFLQQQWQALKKDGWPQALKIGWFPKTEAFIHWLAEKLAEYKRALPSGWIIWDPVLSASQGGLEAGELLRLKHLLPLVDVITPNQQEAQQLTNFTTPIEAGGALQRAGVGYVVISGGDSEVDADCVQNLCLGGFDLSEPEQSVLTNFIIQQPRINEQVHGTGCHFATAIAANLANGERIYDALVLASAAMSLVIQQASQTPSGYLNAWATTADKNGLGNLPAEQWPLVLPLSGTLPLSDHSDADFPNVYKALGLYGLVDNLDWLNTLLELGVDTLQWRVKSPKLYEQHYGDGSYTRDMKTAIELCKQHNIPLYINDDWPKAIELGAYGVHLGQEDMVEANLAAISKAGLALGVSTHTEWEIARARAFKPSYIAFGPVHPPLSKKLKYPPLGYTNLSNWCARVGQEFPLTCIGGITTDNIAHIKKCGMPSAAIVTDLKVDRKLPERYRHFRRSYPASFTD